MSRVNYPPVKHSRSWSFGVDFNLSSFGDSQHRTVHIIWGLSDITQDLPCLLARCPSKIPPTLLSFFDCVQLF